MEEAIGHFLQALRIKPDYERAHNNLGLAHAEQGRTAKSITKHSVLKRRISTNLPIRLLKITTEPPSNASLLSCKAPGLCSKN
jgi:tetratricopeptide (TPR) repeat protein